MKLRDRYNPHKRGRIIVKPSLPIRLRGQFTRSSEGAWFLPPRPPLIKSFPPGMFVSRERDTNIRPLLGLRFRAQMRRGSVSIFPLSSAKSSQSDQGADSANHHRPSLRFRNGSELDRACVVNYLI